MNTAAADRRMSCGGRGKHGRREAACDFIMCSLKHRSRTQICTDTIRLYYITYYPHGKTQTKKNNNPGKVPGKVPETGDWKGTALCLSSPEKGEREGSLSPCTRKGKRERFFVSLHPKKGTGKKHPESTRRGTRKLTAHVCRKAKNHIARAVL